LTCSLGRVYRRNMVKRRNAAASEAVSLLLSQLGQRNAELEAACGKYLASLYAAKGGKASAAALTREQRTAKALAAVSVRWSKRPADELPIDQAQVMARMAGMETVTLRIAPGAGGKRRRAAIASLVRAEKLWVLQETPTEITLSSARPTH
jgi:hypothetical protein